jgi:hypothetical protein
MGLIRGTALIIVSSIFFISLLLSNLFLTLSWSLEHETLYTELQDIAKETLQEYDIIPEINSDFEQLGIYCYDKEFYTFNSGEYSFKIPCETIKQGKNATIEYSIGNFINETYYKSYDCEILECIKTSDQPFVLISEKTKNYFNEKFKITLLLSVVLAILLILLSKKKSNGFIAVGILTGISALPFKGVKWIASLFDNSIIFEFIGVFFSRAHNVFLIMLISGIILFLIGLGLAIMKYGLKFSGWFRKKQDQENETKEKSKEKIDSDKKEKNNQNKEEQDKQNNQKNKENLKPKEQTKKENILKREIKKLKQKLKSKEKSEDNLKNLPQEKTKPLKNKDNTVKNK